MEPAECDKGEVSMSCLSGFRNAGDCCPVCVEQTEVEQLVEYADCLQKCEGQIISCPVEEVCLEGYEFLSCSEGYTVPGDCCPKCVKRDDMKVAAVLLLCAGICFAVDRKEYAECLKNCEGIKIFCPRGPVCDQGEVSGSCLSGYTVPGDCCPNKCVDETKVKQLNQYVECLEKCEGVVIPCPKEPACKKGYESLKCATGYEGLGSCCPKCAEVDN
ncbi:hypothetical protein L9F63_009955 [Diploptera punctata]|uniref:Uncharacterized protein n=1 Tax=Diploptera punctata TaxID=6984 RepID=A0AAD8AIA5_DIPPU|nr:hypothetical protein L9F63_009955 [Diploptera punctata]